MNDYQRRTWSNLGIMSMFLLAVILWLVVGCALAPMPKPAYCDKNDTSLFTDICNKFRLQGSFVKNMFILGNVAALKLSPLYSVEATYGAIDNVRSMVNADTKSTYYQLGQAGLQNAQYVNKYAGREILLVGDILGMIMLSNEKVSDCDALITTSVLDDLELALLAAGYKRSSAEAMIRQDFLLARRAVRLMHCVAEHPGEYALLSEVQN